MRAWETRTPDGDALAVEDRLQKANSVLRVVVLADALALTAYRWDSFTRPWLAVLTCALMVAWTAVAVVAFRVPRFRTPSLLVLDLVMALLAMSATPFAKTPSFNATIAGFWVMGALMAWAIHWRVLGGLVAGVGCHAHSGSGQVQRPCAPRISSGVGHASTSSIGQPQFV